MCRPGLTPRQIVEKFKTIKKVDVVMLTTDNRIVMLPRYIEPKDDVAILLDRLDLVLPRHTTPEDHVQGHGNGETRSAVKTWP